MTLWLRRDGRLDSETMRDIADEAGVLWDYQTIIYRADGIGFADGDPDDEIVVQNAAEILLGYRTRLYDPPKSE